LKTLRYALALAAKTPRFAGQSSQGLAKRETNWPQKLIWMPWPVMWGFIPMLVRMNGLGGLGASESCVQAAPKRLNTSHKKTPEHPKASPESQQIFESKIKTYQEANTPIIHIDGSGFAHDMPRTHGYAPVGVRCFGRRDWRAKGRTNAIGALLGAHLPTACLFSGPGQCRCVFGLDNAGFIAQSI
jgi:hypothetical protein